MPVVKGETLNLLYASIKPKLGIQTRMRFSYQSDIRNRCTGGAGPVKPGARWCVCRAFLSIQTAAVEKVRVMIGLGIQDSFRGRGAGELRMDARVP